MAATPAAPAGSRGGLASGSGTRPGNAAYGGAAGSSARRARTRTLARAPRTLGGSYVSVAVPLRGATVARRGDQPAARRRGLRQGAGRRPEPGPADEAALRVAGARRRHQQRARAELPPGPIRRLLAHRRAVPARRAGALGPAEDH